MQRYKEIMGLKERDYWQVIENVRDTMEIVRRDNLPCTVNLQMVTMPEFHDQIMPLTQLAREIRPHYLIFKHCSVVHHFQLIQSDTAVFRFCEDHEIGARWIEECRYSSSSGKSAGKLASDGYARRTVDYDPRALERCF